MWGLVDGVLRIGGRGGRERHFTIRLPRDAPDAPPLVLMLHGRGGLRMSREGTTFDAQADAWGMAVCHPEGYEETWADGRGVTPADAAGIDDVAFLRAVIAYAAGRYGTPADRTVVAGISNGAFMAHRLAMEASDQVAVVATVAGGLPAYLADAAPAYAVSALLMHGTEDRLAPIGGGHSRHRGPDGELRGRMLSLDATAAHYRALDRCPPGPTHTTAGSSRTTSGAGAGGTRVAAWTVYGHGHAWPGTPTPPPWEEPSSLEFDAAEEICRFARPLLIPAADRRR